MAKAATTAVSTKAEDGKLSAKFHEAYGNAAGNLKNAQENVRKVSQAVVASGRATYEGVLEFDRTVLEHVREGIEDSVTYGREVLKAPSLKAVAEMQKDFATRRLNCVASQLKSLVDLAQARTLEAWAPLQDLVENTAEPVAKVEAAKVEVAKTEPAKPATAA
ncbi:phasin family protein [Paracoccus marinaquae]|uniref:Phasin family protein n=1 Tax=Paracoccus marinaquae TaxID=2841926 RepID=A0ABS6AE81_9RHOB|nr:phasin family protein [Paracoccus marinaquae]MBU3028907.1 phasin family protein [Paracoccus marinaquae]